MKTTFHMKRDNTLVKCPDCGNQTKYFLIEENMISRGHHHEKTCEFYLPNTCYVCDKLMEEHDDANCLRHDIFRPDGISWEESWYDE